MHKILFHGKDEGHFTAIISVFFIILFSVLLSFSSIIQMQYEKLEKEKEELISYIEINNSILRENNETD